MSKQEETFELQRREYVNEILDSHKEYLTKIAWKLVPRNILAAGDLDLIVQDIIQNTCMKFWQKAQKEEILNPKAYLQKIMYHEVVNMIRKYKILLRLPMDNDNEEYSGNVLLTVSQGMGDPLYELEQQETQEERLAQLVEALVSLPLCQKQAMGWLLKERIDDVIALKNAFNRYKLDIDTFVYPDAEKDIPTFRSSLSYARKKLRARLDQLLDK